ncbi:hypothetical protein QCA50_016156 [Cerrena zonata]|uniref:Meiotically up-regulated gene 152 protein n=1 Tax=Cerrena zonata TaxID=2478898 RepID=A0AAW0FJB5_9APHY
MASQAANPKLPPTSAFSFTAPFPPPPPLTNPQSSKQQRRVSLALPSSPRLFPAWSFRDDTSVGVNAANGSSEQEKRGKMRRVESEDGQSSAQIASTSTIIQTQPQPEKKQRKKWSEEETQMLVRGCNKWGVGNWKAILNDSELIFDNRSPVDLKDRFRTYFPDAYRLHYPNAKTHLSSKIRSSLPDGSSIFEKTRSKKRRPFTEEEDRALKEGYDKHGTVWATIVKENPIFLEQGRRSTDLRDRFRNAFPDLYLAAGYKPRASAAKKKKLGDCSTPTTEAASACASGERSRPVRAATDDQLALGSKGGLGPVRRKRRHTTQGLFRGGTKSVPESTANSEDEDSGSDGEDKDKSPVSSANMSGSTASNTTGPLATPEDSFDSAVDMDVQLDSMGQSMSELIADMTDINDSNTTWSNLDTPLTWPTASTVEASLANSPTNDYFLPRPQSPPLMANTMIGKSAWGPDWLSPNPKLENSNGIGGAASTSSSSSYLGGNPTFSPSPLPPSSPSQYSAPHVPLSLSQLSLGSFVQNNQHLHGFNFHSQYLQPHSQAIFDRYDLFPSSQHELDSDIDFVSEGFGASDTNDAHSAFSDPSMGMGGAGMGLRGGFTHHSNYAGDLIFGARTHQPSGHMHMDYGAGFGFGGYGSHPGSASGSGLGLEGVQGSGSQKSGIQHTPALPGIDEIELTGITLDDRDEVVDVPMPLEDAVNIPKSEDELPNGSSSSQQQDSFAMQPLPLDDIIGMPPSDDESRGDQDMNIHITPPHTPVFGRSRALAAGRHSLTGAHTPAQGHGSSHNRSVSVPPSEHRAMAPKPSLSQTQTPNPSRQYKPLPPPTRVNFQPFQLPTTIAPSQIQAQPPLAPHQIPLPPPPDYLSHPVPADFYHLPFLDLHYSNSSQVDLTADSFWGAKFQDNAQALDLAETLSQVHHHPNKLSCIAPSQIQLVPPVGMSGPGHGGAPVAGSSRMQSHHRGQSAAAISPQDLLLRKGSDNKRKRASWDGGPG